METLLTENKKIESNSSKVLFEETIKAIYELDNLIKKKNYQSKNVLDILNYQDLIKNLLNNLSLNQRKKYKRLLNRFRFKQSISSINRFIHYLTVKLFLNKKINPFDPFDGNSFKVNYSEKELKIKQLRAEYVKARELAIVAYNKYKKEKGNFYRQLI